jgi:hypothetical protein
MQREMLFEARLAAERFVADRARGFAKVERKVINQRLLVREITRADAATKPSILFDNL